MGAFFFSSVFDQQCLFECKKHRGKHLHLHFRGCCMSWVCFYVQKRAIICKEYFIDRLKMTQFSYEWTILNGGEAFRNTTGYTTRDGNETCFLEREVEQLIKQKHKIINPCKNFFFKLENQPCCKVNTLMLHASWNFLFLQNSECYQGSWISHRSLTQLCSRCKISTCMDSAERLLWPQI